MHIYIYSDESGVFDVVHNDYFVFGGVLFLDSASRDDSVRKYRKAEQHIRISEKINSKVEIKATNISNKGKYNLFRALNNCYKFGAIVEQKKIQPKIYLHKKSKQRYLDYAFKISVKRLFEQLIRKNIINSSEVTHLTFCVDEHSTATDGRYELCESLEQEFRIGTFNPTWSRYFPPIFPNLTHLELSFCNSASNVLVRAADIIANRIYYFATNGKNKNVLLDNSCITRLP
jgi:hypothetical protein